MSWLSSLFSSGKTEAVSPVDPLLKEQVTDPFTQFLGQQLFGTEGTPAQYGYANFWDSLLGRNPYVTQEAVPAELGALTGADASWAYPGQRVADTSSLQQSAFNQAGSLGTNANLMQALGLNFLGQAPNFQATKDYVGQLWNQDIAPQVMESFAGMGVADSGGAQQALQRAGERTSLGLASTLAPMELQANLGAASQLPSLNEMSTNALNAQTALGILQRSIEQEGLTGAQNYWNESRTWNNPWLQYMYPQTNATAVNYMQQPAGLGYSALGGLGSAVGSALGTQMGAGASLFSALGSIL